MRRIELRSVDQKLAAGALQIADKIASDGWNISEDNLIRFPKRARAAQPQAVKATVQFEKLVPVLKLAA